MGSWPASAGVSSPRSNWLPGAPGSSFCSRRRCSSCWRRLPRKKRPLRTRQPTMTNIEIRRMVSIDLLHESAGALFGAGLVVVAEQQVQQRTAHQFQTEGGRKQDHAGIAIRRIKEADRPLAVEE